MRVVTGGIMSTVAGVRAVPTVWPAVIDPRVSTMLIKPSSSVMSSVPFGLAFVTVTKSVLNRLETSSLVYCTEQFMLVPSNIRAPASDH